MKTLVKVIIILVILALVVYTMLFLAKSVGEEKYEENWNFTVTNREYRVLNQAVYRIYWHNGCYEELYYSDSILLYRDKSIRFKSDEDSEMMIIIGNYRLAWDEEDN